MSNLSEKIAIVTGGATGIGYATVKRFLQEKIESIIILGLDLDMLEKVKLELDLDFNSNRIHIYQCDISSNNNIKYVFSKIFQNFSHIDILVNNAGIISDSSFVNITLDKMQKVMDTNFYGTFNCIKQVLPQMIKQKYGKIVNVSSTSTFGTINKSNYSASKSAIDGLTRSICKEIACNNITINSVVPGLIDTNLIKTIPENLLPTIIENSPMKRMGTSEEVASVIFFLSNDDSSYITGENILVCGGLQTNS